MLSHPTRIVLLVPKWTLLGEQGAMVGHWVDVDGHSMEQGGTVEVFDDN